MTPYNQAEVPMSNASEARQILRAHRYGALCTLSKKFDGYPFGSITPYLTDHDGSLIIFISTLAEHTKNIQNDPRVSLITHNQNAPHIQTQGRVTVVGEAVLLADREQAGIRYFRYFPEAQAYMGMHDFSFYRIAPIAIRYIGGFGKIHWADLTDYVPNNIENYARQEAQLLATINTRQKNILSLLLQRQHEVNAPDCQAIGLDCDGLDVRSGDRTWRLSYAEELPDPA
jgi:putative heme iron utilization protein